MDKVTLPQFPISGGCQCGAVRYTLKAAPLVFYLCHCTDCQKQSSSAFGESVRVRADDVEITGQLALYTGTADSGRGKYCQFCPTCGTRLFHRRTPDAEVLNIKGGSLDDAKWLRPSGHIWTRSKQAFISIGDDELSYPEQPDDDALTARWQQMCTPSPPL